MNDASQREFQPYVVGEWVCLFPHSPLPNGACFKCGSGRDIRFHPITARGVRAIGYRMYQTLTTHLRVPLCPRCRFIREYSALLITMSALLGLGLPVLAGVLLRFLPIGLALLMMLGGPIAGFVFAILFYRRSAVMLGGIDERGAVEVKWVHPTARAEIEAQQL